MADVPSYVQEEVIQLEPRPGTPIGKELLLFDTAEERVIFHGGAVIARYEIKDRTAEAAVRVMLARSGLVTQTELAEGFGVHRNTLGRALRDLETGGMAAVLPAKRGPKGPYKVTPEVLQLVAEHAEKALPDLIRLLEQEGVHLSRSHVHLLQKRARNAAREQLELMSAGAGQSKRGEPDTEAPPLGAEEAVETALGSGLEQPSVEVPPVEPEAVPGLIEPYAREAGREPLVRVPEQAEGRYMGASLFFPAIRQLGLLEAALSCFRLPHAELFGVRAVTLTLFFMTLLSRTTLEAAKHLRRWEFGPLIGVVRAPVVKTLRRKLTELIKQGQALSFGQLLLQRWIQQGVVATAYLYVDGHMKAYTGKRELSEVYNSQRRLAMPGVLNYFVNDQQGRPLLFITEPANASLAKAMPRILEAIRKALGGRPFTIIFDRGGYDSKLFTWLQQQEVQFITYQQGTPKLTRERFRRHECHFEGRRVRMRLALDEVKVSDSGPWRRIVVLTKEGKQTPILTNVTRTAPAKIACLIFARWRQENFFRYSKEHQGLDQLLGYAWEELDGQTSIPNPELKKLARQLKLKRSQRAQLQARVGQALLSKAEVSKKSGDAHKDQTALEALAQLEAEIEGLNRRRKELPERVPLSTVGERHTLLLQQKAIIDRIKITAYNAEEMLLELLAVHYSNLHDIRDLLRAFCQLSGQLRATRQGVQITLDPPDNPTHRRALRGLCADLNKFAPTYPGTDLPLRYDVGVHHAEAAA